MFSLLLFLILATSSNVCKNIYGEAANVVERFRYLDESDVFDSSGERKDGTIEKSLSVLFSIPRYSPSSMEFRAPILKAVAETNSHSCKHWHNHYRPFANIARCNDLLSEQRQ